MSGLEARLQFRQGALSRVGAERIAVLEAIARAGSISGAARALGLSYRGTQDSVRALNALVGRPLVQAQAGGRDGGAAVVTPAGQALVLAFRQLERELAHVMGQLADHLDEGDETLERLTWRFGMKTSARNTLPGVVEAVSEGAVNSEVRLRLPGGATVVAVITRESVAELGLAPGREATALIKASFVILAAGHEPLRTSARNHFTGVVVARREGAVNDEVTLEVDGGLQLSATVTRESAEGLGLDVGAPAQALVKASHVIVAVD